MLFATLPCMHADDAFISLIHYSICTCLLYCYRHHINPALNFSFVSDFLSMAGCQRYNRKTRCKRKYKATRCIEYKRREQIDKIVDNLLLSNACICTKDPQYKSIIDLSDYCPACEEDKVIELIEENGGVLDNEDAPVVVCTRVSHEIFDREYHSLMNQFDSTEIFSEEYHSLMNTVGESMISNLPDESTIGWSIVKREKLESEVVDLIYTVIDMDQAWGCWNSKIYYLQYHECTPTYREHLMEEVLKRTTWSGAGRYVQSVHFQTAMDWAWCQQYLSIIEDVMTIAMRSDNFETVGKEEATWGVVREAVLKEAQVYGNFIEIQHFHLRSMRPRMEKCIRDHWPQFETNVKIHTERAFENAGDGHCFRFYVGNCVYNVRSGLGFKTLSKDACNIVDKHIRDLMRKKKKERSSLGVVRNIEPGCYMN
jgi:hypothetical protein